ncbi:MAG: hydrogenase maturation nickel metallochaperone HypA [Clostridiaceae bacterium]
MHELSITESIIKICSEEACKNKASKVKSIKIVIGDLTGLIPESIQYYFDIASKETRVEGAKLIIEKMPIKIECRNCKAVTPIKRGIFACPKCNSDDISMISGNEFYVDSMEVD